MLSQLNEIHITIVLMILSISQMQNLINNIKLQIHKSDIICLDGPLGAGKSTIAKMIIENYGFKYLGSPTFSKINSYENNKLKIWHCDLYQASNVNMIDEYIYEIEDGILIVEWASMYPSLFKLENVWTFNISHHDKESRNLQLSTPRNTPNINQL